MTAASPWRPFGPRSSKTLPDRVGEQVAARPRDLPARGTHRSRLRRHPGRPGVAIDTTAISRLIDYPFADMTITVEAGMTLSALRAILATQHQRVLVDAPHPDRATLGGIYATNTSGPRRFSAGRPRDQIIGVSFVTSDGVVVKGGGRVVKNVAGYDFPKLLTGSMGTLGIITQMTLKVRPIPEASALVWVPFWNPKNLADTLDQLNTSATRPIALELLTLGRNAGRPRTGLADRPGSSSSASKTTRRRSRGSSTAEDRAEPRRFRGRRGRRRRAALEALTEFQAARAGPISFVANLRPSSVASFIDGLDPERWSVQAHARQRDRPRPCPGRVDAREHGTRNRQAPAHSRR